MSCMPCTNRSSTLLMSDENQPIVASVCCSRLSRATAAGSQAGAGSAKQAVRKRGGANVQITRHQAGPRMSKAVVHGDTVYLAGIVAEAPKEKTVAEQAKDILRQIDALLAQAGTDKSKLLSANI